MYYKLRNQCMYVHVCVSADKLKCQKGILRHFTIVFNFFFSFCLSISLTPSNCPAVGDRGLYESYPWFEMMVKLQSITQDLKSKSLE